MLEDGTRLEADVVIWCTGFRVDDPLGAMTVTGADGADLKGWWGSRPRAYLGIAVPHFPDAFILLGPNTALGHSSVLLMIEAQVRWISANGDPNYDCTSFCNDVEAQLGRFFALLKFWALSAGVVERLQRFATEDTNE